MVRVIKYDKLSVPHKNAMNKKIKRSLDKTWEKFDEETEEKLQEIENLNLSYEHEIFRTTVSHSIVIGNATFNNMNIFEVGLITKGY